MAGTKVGGAKARETNIKRHGADFYKRIGAIGGRNGHTGGFAANPELARIAGAKGGRISRRGPAKKDKDIDEMERILEEESGRA
jgi:general stress protein YciG